MIHFCKHVSGFGLSKIIINRANTIM